MTGYASKRAAAQDKLDNDDALTIAYQSGYYDGKKAAQRPWVGLTDEEIKAVNAQVSQIPPIDYTTTTYAKAIEAKLKERNGG